MIFFVIAALLVVLDQATKFYIRATMAVGATKVLIPNWLGLNYVQNTGAAFSSFDQYTMILAIVSLVVFVLLFVPGNPVYMGKLAIIMFIGWMVIGLILYLISGSQRRGMTQDQLREGVFHGMEERKHQA